MASTKRRPRPLAPGTALLGALLAGCTTAIPPPGPQHPANPDAAAAPLSLDAAIPQAPAPQVPAGDPHAGHRMSH